MKIALYGKGGIGKSTISANLSAALAQQGYAVLQIGCDPKHDSTRLLLGGKSVVTAMEYMKNTPASQHRLDRVLHTGYGGVVCAEAGGPEPGVGCAGRGILSTFALFERLGLDFDSFDVVLYDVLGDVVCGGFAVPLRRDYADRVYVVTSEEFMSLYAANNILKGVKNYDDEGHRLAGLILNSRGGSEAKEPAEQFAELVGLPILQTLPRSDIFRRAEQCEKTVVEAFPESAEALLFHALAQTVMNNSTVYGATFLAEEHLEKELFGLGEAHLRDGLTTALPTPQEAPTEEATTAARKKEPLAACIGSGSRATPFLSKSLLNREPLHGCAFSGALATLTQIDGAVTVAHGPVSCSYIAGQAIFSSGSRTLTREKILLDKQLHPRIISSDMDESMVIYGGKERLVQSLDNALKRNPGAVFVVTTCPSGVIGDDPLAAIHEVRDRCPEIPIIPITSDGNLRGDYMQGVINGCMEGAAALINRGTPPEPHCVNILAEKNIAFNAEHNFTTVQGLLTQLGLTVNCRFVRNTSVEALEGFCKASLCLPAYTDYLGRLMAEFAGNTLGLPSLSLPFPVGFSETAAWLREICSFFHLRPKGEQLIEQERDFYREKTSAYAASLRGKRLMIITYIHNVDWIVEAAMDLGMEVVKVGILHYSQDNLFVTRYPGQFEVETDYDPAQRDDDLRHLRPDLLLANYTPANLPFPLHADIIPLCPDVGFYGGLAFAHRWSTLLKSPVVEGWKHDAPR